MRIRKNSRLVINGRSSSTSLLVCQVNRSPWDIDAFSSQGEWGECSFTRNGSMGDSSRYSGESMELSFEYMPPQSKRESNETQQHEDDEFATLDDGRVEYILSDYRSLTSNSCVPNTNTSTKKGVGTTPPVPPPEPKRRGRPRKVVEGVGERNSENVSEDDSKIKMNIKDKKKGEYIENVMDEELDYIESEDEEERYGGRRVRKPIKARSLKSLM